MGTTVPEDAVEVTILMDSRGFYLVHPRVVTVAAGGTVTFRNPTDASAELFLDERPPFQGISKAREHIADKGGVSMPLRVVDEAGVYKYRLYMTPGEEVWETKPPQFAKAGSRPSIIILPQ